MAMVTLTHGSLVTCYFLCKLDKIFQMKLLSQRCCTFSNILLKSCFFDFIANIEQPNIE